MWHPRARHEESQQTLCRGTDAVSQKRFHSIKQFNDCYVKKTDANVLDPTL